MEKVNILILDENLEKNSKFGIPYHKANTWLFKDDCNNIGSLRAITEMEALERLREAFKEVGRIYWITYKEFQELSVK